VVAGPGTGCNDDDHHRATDDDHRSANHDVAPVNRFLRLVALVCTLLLVQVCVFPHLRLLGAVPDVGLLLTIAVAFHEGPEAALLTGFAAGFGYDLFLQTPVGLSALVYALMGYAVGILQTGVLRSPKWVTPFFGGAGGLVAGVAFVVLGVLAGADVAFTEHTFAIIAAASLYDAILAPFVFVLVTRVLGRQPEPVARGWAR
jgi:rod shape-determining protein MreD